MHDTAENAQGDRPVVLITGGSSGIGRALAIRMARKGYDLALWARGADRLAETRRLVEAEVPEVRVHTVAVDVGDTDAVTRALDDVCAVLGTPHWAILNAGIAQPGRFLDQPLADHADQMRTNYFGALHVAHAIAPLMRTRGGGHLAFVSSGAAFFGIYGYAAYAPSKFAMRGLAEVLRVELASDNIHVTLAYPPDTETPQLETENRTKPAITKEIAAGGGLWSAQRVAERIIDGMERNRFIVAPGMQMWLLSIAHSLLGPALRWHQARIVRKHERR